MPDKYTLKEIRIEVAGGVTLVADVSSVDGVRSLLADLANAKIMPVSNVSSKSDQQPPTRNAESDTPESRMETRAALEPGTMGTLNLLAFKDDVPQLLRPGQLSQTDAVLSLLFALEAGLRMSKVEYEWFKDLYEAQNIKSGSPLAMILTNLRNSGYLDKKTYQADKSLRLTAKGEKKAIEILKKGRGD